jgi:hypothetical protein
VNTRRPLLSPLWFIIALTTILGINVTSAAANNATETRVRAIATVTVDAVGQPSSETAAHVGCLRPVQPGFVSGSCVATEAETGLVTAGETCNSFEHDTDVLMADGTRKPIDDVKVGDSVIATDPATAKTGPHAVTALIRHTTDHVIVDVSVAGENGVETIAATDHHPFYVTGDGGRWVNAGALAVGDELRSPDGTNRVIVGVSTHRAHETVYNLTIEGVHTYYVGGGDPVLVHNSGPCLDAIKIAQHANEEGHMIPGVDPEELDVYVDRVIQGPGQPKVGGGTIWWDSDTGAVVIRNPDGYGTTFVPNDGFDYFLRWAK